MQLFSDGVNSAAPAPLPDERVLEMAGIKLAEVTWDSSFTLTGQGGTVG